VGFGWARRRVMAARSGVWNGLGVKNRRTAAGQAAWGNPRATRHDYGLRLGYCCVFSTSPPNKSLSVPSGRPGPHRPPHPAGAAGGWPHSNLKLAEAVALSPTRGAGARAAASPATANILGYEAKLNPALLGAGCWCSSR
jgi:hypothetical protein